MVFLDEPTSGLDSYSAVQLCQVLKKVANSGASVLFTIHQPSSEIFNSFDNLILMNKGRVMYQGPVDGVTDYFEVRGHPVPPHYNPADWIMVRNESREPYGSHGLDLLPSHCSIIFSLLSECCTICASKGVR